MEKKIYTSDSHFLHKNILLYCERKFDLVDQCDQLMMLNLKLAESQGFNIYHQGDVSFNLELVLAKYGWLERPKDHTLIVGNHDKFTKQVKTYKTSFGQTVGTEKTWFDNSLIIEDEGYKILLSHNPQRDLQGCDFNIFGHVHNNLTRPGRDGYIHPEMWVVGSQQHLNCCVELHNYAPATLEQLIENKDKQWEMEK